MIAPDMVGFGFSDRPAGITDDRTTRIARTRDLLDGFERVDVVGDFLAAA